MFRSLRRPGRPASRIHVLNCFDTKAVVQLFFSPPLNCWFELTSRGPLWLTRANLLPLLGTKLSSTSCKFCKKNLYCFVNPSQCHVVASRVAYQQLPLSGSVSTLHLILCQYNIKEQYWWILAFQQTCQLRRFVTSWCFLPEKVK